MKKAGKFVLCPLLCLALTACAAPEMEPPPETPAPAQTATTAPSPTAAPVAHPTPAPWAELPSAQEAEEAREAYAAALERMRTENILPDGSDYSNDGIPDEASMTANEFAVYDVDGDGREELILLYTTTVVAGEKGMVMDWNAESKSLRTQLLDFPLLTFYASGAAKAGWSHNQGKGGDFWPYNLYRYDGFTDSYLSVGSVDAWDENIGAENYPQEVDTSDTGFVYYIFTSYNMTWDDPLDASVYQAWLYPYLRNTAVLEVPYQHLTQENIQSITKLK